MPSTTGDPREVLVAFLLSALRFLLSHRCNYKASLMSYKANTPHEALFPSVIRVSTFSLPKDAAGVYLYIDTCWLESAGHDMVEMDGSNPAPHRTAPNGTSAHVKRTGHAYCWFDGAHIGCFKILPVHRYMATTSLNASPSLTFVLESRKCAHQPCLPSTPSTQPGSGSKRESQQRRQWLRQQHWIGLSMAFAMAMTKATAMALALASEQEILYWTEDNGARCHVM